ncbi:hypothetical protein PIB30_064418, partial [Stylosanthes scabra]|nr:hypothetical protein [Stylosanthes scabra]
EWTPLFSRHGVPLFTDCTLPPSHSALAFTTSSTHKRKLASEDHAPPFLPSSFFVEACDGALTSNNDLESIFARGTDSDLDAKDAVVDDDEDDYNNDSSMHNFTTARLDRSASAGGTSAPVAPNSKPVMTMTRVVAVVWGDGFWGWD